MFSLQSRESHGITWQILINPSSGGFQHLVPEEGLPSHAGGEGESQGAISNLSSEKKKRFMKSQTSILVSDQPPEPHDGAAPA